MPNATFPIVMKIILIGIKKMPIPKNGKKSQIEISSAFPTGCENPSIKKPIDNNAKVIINRRTSTEIK